jgi:hypothetical protein
MYLICIQRALSIFGFRFTFCILHLTFEFRFDMLVPLRMRFKWRGRFAAIVCVFTASLIDRRSVQITEESKISAEKTSLPFSSKWKSNVHSAAETVSGLGTSRRPHHCRDCTPLRVGQLLCRLGHATSHPLRKVRAGCGTAKVSSLNEIARVSVAPARRAGLTGDFRVGRADLSRKGEPQRDANRSNERANMCVCVRERERERERD